MARVLITGSRRCSPAMADKAKEVVKWIVDNGHCLIVGDAVGVDSVTVNEMQRLSQSSNMEVCSAYSRALIFPGVYTGTVLKNGNLFRNRFMVRKCDLCVAIWDGRSNGTRYTFEYAQAQGKRVIVRNFAGQKLVNMLNKAFKRTQYPLV